jgi:hypothetical protein
MLNIICTLNTDMYINTFEPGMTSLAVVQGFFFQPIQLFDFPPQWPLSKTHFEIQVMEMLERLFFMLSGPIRPDNVLFSHKAVISQGLSYRSLNECFSLWCGEEMLKRQLNHDVCALKWVFNASVLAPGGS